MGASEFSTTTKLVTVVTASILSWVGLGLLVEATLLLVQ